MLARVLVAVYSKYGTDRCYFPTPESLILTFFKYFFCKRPLLELFGKQFEIVEETVLHTNQVAEKTPLTNPNPNPIFNNEKLKINLGSTPCTGKHR